MKIGNGSVEIRRRNLIADDAYPCASPAGLRFEQLSHHASLAKLLGMMDYDALRADRQALRRKSIHRGIGLASFIEVTNPSAAFYGVGGARISSQDGVAVRLDGQGSVIAKPALPNRAGVGVAHSPDRRQCTRRFDGSGPRYLGDTDNTPYGGGTWASRGAGIGGEARCRLQRSCAKISLMSPLPSCNPRRAN